MNEKPLNIHAKMAAHIKLQPETKLRNVTKAARLLDAHFQARRRDIYKLLNSPRHKSGELNPLMSTGNYSAASINMKLVHWPLMGGLLHLVQRGGGLGGLGPRPVPSSLYEM